MKEILADLSAQIKISHMPKSKFIENYFIDMINEGVLKKGMKLPSINELAGKCKIARETVVKSYNLLKSKGLIESRHGKGFIVIKSKYKKSVNVFILLDVMSNSYKEQLVRGLNENLGNKVSITCFAHRYNPEMFVNLIEDAVGRYEYYAVFAMRDKSTFKSVLKIPQNRLLLLDVPADIPDCESSYIYQNSDENFYKALSESLPFISKYKKFYMIFDPSETHPVERISAFKRFCSDNSLDSRILDDFSEAYLEKGAFFMVMDDNHLVDILLSAKDKGLKVKDDFGVISYNDSPIKKVVADGAAVISIDFYNLGKMLAQQLQDWNPNLREVVPTYFIRRGTV